MFVSTMLVKILATKLKKPNDENDLSQARDVRHEAGSTFFWRWKNEGDCLIWVVIIFSASFFVTILAEAPFKDAARVHIIVPIISTIADLFPIGLICWMHHGGMRLNK